MQPSRVIGFGSGFDRFLAFGGICCGVAVMIGRIGIPSQWGNAMAVGMILRQSARSGRADPSGPNLAGMELGPN